MGEINSVLYGIIGKRISELRKLNNNNQQELAERISLKRSSISNIELGRQQVSLHVLYKISRVYNTEIYALLPTVNELASKVSLDLETATETLEQKNIGSITQKEILELLK